MSTTNKLYTFKDILTSGVIIKEGDVEVLKQIDEILIPMIQRPYAQGRKSQDSVRTKFLNDIFTVLSDATINQLELNFLYGTFVNQEDSRNVFELLDGQQRMTTLFLLHWYFSNKEKHNEGFVWPDYLKKFTYQTRTTSTDFLNKLVSKEIKFESEPSKAIRKSAWYSKSFDKDTTIDAMLRMLDCIDKYYTEAENKPTFNDLDKLKFYVLELNGFGLTEELFIKMNARGLQLTPFENFKADLISFMKKNEEYSNMVDDTLSRIPRKVAYWLNFSSLMDGRWLDLFWQKPEGYEDSGSTQCDICFFRFIQRFFANKAILLTDKSNRSRAKDDELLQFFANNTEVDQHLGFEKYIAILNKAKAQGEDSLRCLEKVLNYLSDSNIGERLLNGLTAPWEKQRQWQPWSSVNEVGQRQMIIFLAMTEFILKTPSIEKFNIEAYRKWMRFTHSFVQGSDVTGIDSQITISRQLREILDIDNATNEPYNAIVSYNSTHRDNRYLAAEAEKAKRVLDEPEWNDAFVEAEKDTFTQGSCMFYYQQEIDIETYTKRTKNVALVFDENGVSGRLSENYLLLKGVMCRNYDWSAFRRDTYNFTITNKGANRYLRNLTIWNDNKEVKRFFCELLDCNSIDEMVEYISQVVQENHQVVFNPKQFDNQCSEDNLNKVYRRLYKENEMKAMQWLYSSGIPSIGVYYHRDGKASLYKGNVNCFYLGNERHRYVTRLCGDFKQQFDFQFTDTRQQDDYAKFGNYSGNALIVFSKDDILPQQTKLQIIFYNDDAIAISTNNVDFANKLFEEYRSFLGVDNFKDLSGKDIMEDGRLTSFFWYEQEFYRVFVGYDTDKTGYGQLEKLLQMAYDTIQGK